MTKNENLSNQVQAQEKEIKVLSFAEKRVAELKAEIDLLRNPQKLNLQEIKRDLRFELQEEYRAREEDLVTHEATVKCLLEEVKEGMAKIMLREEDSLTSKMIVALKRC